MNIRILLPLLVFSLSAWAGESGIALKDDSLRKEPYSDAATAGNIKRNDKIEILEKKGAWLKVKTSGGSGWVRMLSVRRGTAAQGSSGQGVLNLASGRSGTGQVVATTGVRGLNEEELKAAKFNEAEIKQMEAYAASADNARQFAQAGGLQARKLDYLPDPAAKISGSTCPQEFRG